MVETLNYTFLKFFIFLYCLIIYANADIVFKVQIVLDFREIKINPSKALNDCKSRRGF